MPRATTRNEGDRIVNIGLASEEFLFALAIRSPADDRAFLGALGPNILEVAGRLIGKMPAASAELSADDAAAGLLGLEHGYFDTAAHAAPTGSSSKRSVHRADPKPRGTVVSPPLTGDPDFLVTCLLAMVVAVTVRVRHSSNGSVAAPPGPVDDRLFSRLQHLFRVLVGIAGTKFVAPLSWWRAYLPSGIARMLAGLCP